MQTLERAMLSGPNAGTPIPTPFYNFNSFGISPRRGQVSLLAGAPGAGKSAMMSHFAVHATPKIPTLYFSCDTDFMTLGVRIASSVMDKPLTEVDELIRENDKDTWKALSEATSHIWFHWDTAPSCQDIADEVTAYAYVTGAWPHLIVIDNLINIDMGDDSTFRMKDQVIHWLQDLARITNAAVVILHHVTGEYEDGNKPIPLSGLLDKVGKRPRLVLTLYRVTDNLLGVRVVKNSSGKSATDGSYGPDIAWMPERSWMKG